MLRRDDDPHIRINARIEHVLAEPHAVARDHVAALEPRDSGDHGGTRNAELAREIGDAFSRVRLKQRHEVAVEIVELVEARRSHRRRKKKWSEWCGLSRVFSAMRRVFKRRSARSRSR